MSQDSEVCAKCGVLCGYDDEKGYWEGHNLAICSRCKGNLTRRFWAFFGLDGGGYTGMGLEIEWQDVDKILGKVKRDTCMRVCYIVSDKELYEREILLKTPVESEN